MEEIKELENAIQHCKDVQQNCTNEKCSMEHKQLETWLTELMLIKKGELVNVL
jgi:hypothetical protein